MKLTIKGPEEDCEVEITEKGTYWVGRTGYITRLYGRREETDWLAIGHTSISSAHLGICIDDHVNLTDLESKFGSYLDGRKIEKESFKLPGERTLKLGNVEFLLKYEP